ncbi:uncharacterized protein LOC130046436 isoform X2 [Ostrea edulis]|nr:uncharacterized protein LOC125657127 isoform X2 [Ostrea edulis]XP_056004390.1 uncharacterized protein LOC130046436 isoform X2 [Ostrea edulis]
MRKIHCTKYKQSISTMKNDNIEPSEEINWVSKCTGANDDATCSSEINTDFISRNVNSIVKTVRDIMNCSLTKCDEVEHKRHHQFMNNPEKVYRDNFVKYCFGANYIQPEELEYLQHFLYEMMCTSKFLPGSIFSRYSTFVDCKNEQLEQIFIVYPLMGHQYLKFVVLKEAMIHLVCISTGLPYEEENERCIKTEMSVAEFRCGAN